MNMTADNRNSPKPRETVETVAKKPYTKPAFRFERVFETRALSCGKMQDTQGSCHHNRRAS
jgi:hypothetical protein